MGKKKDLTESESDTNTETESVDTSSKKNNSLFDKINKLSRKAKLYISICVVLLLAGLYMWYKNKNNNIQTIQNVTVPAQQVGIQTGAQEVAQAPPVLSHLTPNALEN